MPNKAKRKKSKSPNVSPASIHKSKKKWEYVYTKMKSNITRVRDLKKMDRKFQQSDIINHENIKYSRDDLASLKSSFNKEVNSVSSDSIVL